MGLGRVEWSGYGTTYVDEIMLRKLCTNTVQLVPYHYYKLACYYLWQSEG